MDWAFYLPVAPVALAIAMAVTAVAAAVQGTVGFGFAIVSVPVLSLVDPALAPVPQLLVTLPLAGAMLWRERREMDLRGVGWILLGRLPGALLGLVLIELAAPRALDAILGGLVLLAVGLLVSGLEVRRSPVTDLGAGIASGTFSLVSSIGGPPIALLYRNEKGPTVRSSLAAIFSIGLVITIATRAVAGEISQRDVEVAVCLMPALLFGLWTTRWLTGHAEGKPLRLGILAVASVAALGLIGRAVWG